MLHEHIHHTDVSRKNFGDDRPIIRASMDLVATVRKVDRLRSAGHGTQEEADQLITSTGYTEGIVCIFLSWQVSILMSTQPAAFQLVASRPRFFRRWNMCLMHLAPLGLIKLHVILLGRLFGPDFQNSMWYKGVKDQYRNNSQFFYFFLIEVNSRAKSLKRFSGQLALNKGVYRILSKGKGINKITSRAFTANEWDTVVEVSLYLFNG